MRSTCGIIDKKHYIVWSIMLCWNEEKTVKCILSPVADSVCCFLIAYKRLPVSFEKRTKRTGSWNKATETANVLYNFHIILIVSLR